MPLNDQDTNRCSYNDALVLLAMLHLGTVCHPFRSHASSFEPPQGLLDPTE